MTVEPLRAPEVCLIGAGPAGLGTALALAAAGVRVVLLEAGLAEATKLIREIRSAGEDPYPQSSVAETRACGWGGTAGIWSYRMSGVDDDPDAGARGCRYAPLDPIDFEARPQVAGSGWPLSRTDLDPWYQRAQQVCGLARYDYEPGHWSAPGREPLPLDDALIETQMFQFGPATAWTRDAVARLRSAAGVQILTGTQVTELELDPTGTRVTAVHWRRADGSTGKVPARCTILAAGGIENSRLLLLSDRTMSGGPGNAGDQVGRYWMEHPLVRGGMLVSPASARLGSRLRLYDAHHQENVPVMAKLAVSADLVRREGLLSTSALLLPRHDVLASTAVQAFTALRSPSGRNAPWPARLAMVRRIAVGGIDLLTARRVMSVPAKHPGLDLSGWAARPEADRFRVFELVHQTEQSPDPENRIVLSADLDQFGRRLPVLHWRWSAEDQDRITRSRDLYAQAFAAAGLGTVIQQDWDGGRPRFLGGNHHHLGGTRMSASSATGVVDRNCRVHGTVNLFVAGSSVFPTGGSVNPTLTIVALALRLAAHLQQELPRLPASADQAATP